MKKTDQNVERMVQDERSRKNLEKLYFVQYAQVRRHSRVLYLPLDPIMVRLHKIKKGDTIKYQTLELRRAADENARIPDPGEL